MRHRFKPQRVHHRKTQRERAVVVSVSMPLWLKLDAESTVLRLGLRGISELIQLRLRPTDSENANRRILQPGPEDRGGVS